MAPEILNEENYDEKADVYSFGVLLYFMLSGGEMPKITVIQVGTGKKAKIPFEFTALSKSLIDRCWNFDPKKRPSFEEILNELHSKDYKIVELSNSEVKDIRLFVEAHKKRIPKLKIFVSLLKNIPGKNILKPY